MNNTELRPLIEKIARYQDALKLSDKNFCARFSKYIGSPKTWRQRMRDGDLKDLNAEKWSSKLRELIARLEGGSAVEEFYSTLPFYQRLDARVSMLEGQTNDRRIVAALAQTGCSKTVSSRHLVEVSLSKEWHGAQRIFVTALNTWRENKQAILNGLAEALSCLPEQPSAPKTMAAIISTLRASPRTIFVDEAHQGGVMLMRIIKDLVNETPSRFVYIALRTEFERVRNATQGSIIEAKQFMRRCLQPVFDDYASGTRIEDVKEFLIASTNGADGVAIVSQDILAIIRRHGNLSTLSDAVEEARSCAEDSDEPVTPALILDTLRAITSPANL